MNSFCHAAGSPDMVVFQKNTIGKIITMVVAAAYFYCVFFKDSHIWGGFSGIQKFCFAAFQQFCDRVCISGDTAHSLEII